MERRSSQRSPEMERNGARRGAPGAENVKTGPKPRLREPRKGLVLPRHAAVGAVSLATGAGVPPPEELSPPDDGVRGVQSLGGRGGLPAMMSSSLSLIHI